VIAGAAAVLVDPRSVDEIRSAMVSLATDPDLRDELRRRGLARARKFSWETSAHAADNQKANECGRAG
jgi:glycosyltransferase involved in cell wall biosynthesis